MVFPVKYRRKAVSDFVEKTIVEIGIGISERYEIYFFEIGADENHIHFLIQRVPKLSVEVIVRIVKSLMAKEISKRHTDVKQILDII